MMIRITLILGLIGLLFSLLFGQKANRTVWPQLENFPELFEQRMLHSNRSDFHFWQGKRSLLRSSDRLAFRQRHLLPGEQDFARTYHSFPPENQRLSDNVQVAWVSYYGSGMLYGDDIATDIAIDMQGNIYVTGSPKVGIGPGTEYITVKYSSDGVLLWTKSFKGGLFNTALAITVDGAGNVYVTGCSFSSDANYDYATIKYDSSGSQQWVAYYNGPGNDKDVATALAVDGAGNVYVTGYSIGSGGNYDYATVKYDASGVEMWVMRHNGRGNSDDKAKALAIDSASNVYITGYCEGSGTGLDYTTIKYDALGVEQWVARYNGPGNDKDVATALAVDSTSNVYVTGYSIGSGGNYDYATVKYNASGVERWVARYDGPGNGPDEATALAVDDSGNVYVTGYSENLYMLTDYATLKYDSSGIEQWEARYEGPIGLFDEATAISVDTAGNVYVTGRSMSSVVLFQDYDYATVKYNASGVQQWVARYDWSGDNDDIPIGLVLDRTGNVYVTGYSANTENHYDYATIKYNDSGVEQWAARYNGLGISTDLPTDIAVNDNGRIYVTGRSLSCTDGYNYATLGYNASGEEQWVAIFNGAGNSVDVPTAMAVDDNGDIIITGRSTGLGTGYDYATLKYNDSGVQQWLVCYNGPGNSDDRATALTVDIAGNVYVTGFSWDSGTNEDYATVKYNASGVEHWVARYNGSGNWNDEAMALAVDGSGNVYVTGFSYGNGTNKDYATVKYNASGVQQWVAHYNGPGNSDDDATALAVDVNGYIYVTGYSKDSNSNYDYATIKYDNLGIQQWVTRYNGPGNSIDKAFDLAVDKFGNVYITGYSEGSGTGYDYATVKYDASGVEQWVARYNGQGNSEDQATALWVDRAGNVYVTGYSKGSNTNYDFATVKYDPSGAEQWVARYNLLGNSDDRAMSLKVDSSGNVYVTGYSYVHGSSIYTTIKYIQTPTGVVEVPLGVPRQYRLLQNYPNPFNPSTTIEFTLISASEVSLVIYNVAGQEVDRLINHRRMTQGSYQVEWVPRSLPSGVYFYRLSANGFSQSRKMVFLK